MKTQTLHKHAALILLQCLFCVALLAQTSPLPKQWDKRFGGALEDRLNSLDQTTDGGYIIGGGSASSISGDKTEVSRGGYDFWVVKMDANGIKEWDKRFGGTRSDYLFSLQQTNDGGYILGGFSSSDIGGDKTEASRGKDDYWVVKIDANGVKQWDKRFGGSQDDLLSSVQQTTDGGYILGGKSYSGIDGDKSESTRGLSDYWIVKIDANGTKQWDKVFGGSSSDYLTSLQQTTDGGYILGGYSHSGISGDKTENNLGGYDYWIVKINVNGIQQLDKTFGGASDDILKSTQQTKDGGYILGGGSTSGISGNKTEASRGNSDYWVVKLNRYGTIQWDKTYGGSNFDQLNSLQQTIDGGYILGGDSYSEISGDKTQSNRGNADYWVVKLGCPPNTEVTTLSSLDICQTGSVTLKAYSAEDYQYQWIKNNKKIVGATDNFYTVTEPGTYSVVVYTSRDCGDVSKVINVTNSCGKVSSNLNVSPNPSKGIITAIYNSTTQEIVRLNVFDKTGKLMFTKTESAIKGSNTYQLNLSHLINGMYNLQINNASRQSQVKFVIER